MTFRAKPVAKRTHRTALESSGRRTLYLNLFFGGVVLLGVLILAGAAGASYWDEHFATLASVNGTGITKDQFRERYRGESFRLEYTERQIRTDQAAGRITDAQAQQQFALLQQRRDALEETTIENLIDATLMLQLAEREGIAITDQDIAERLQREATTPERRRVWLIVARPETTAGAEEPTDQQKAAARTRAEGMLAEIRGGTAFDEVARAGSDDASKANGGDIGFLIQEAEFYDSRAIEAAFGLQANDVSDVVEGDDGLFYIVRTTEIVPEAVNSSYEQELKDASVNLSSYRDLIRAEVARERLRTSIVDAATLEPTPQRNVSEIFIASDPAKDTQGDEVNSRHILFSPNDDPQGAGTLAADDPAWGVAETEARAAYEELKADPSKFVEVAKARSDDAGTRDSGGDLGFLSRPELDPGFAGAIFVDGLSPDQILEPVKSSFGWHVIQFIERREAPQNRIRAVELRVAAGEDFAALAREFSESSTKSDDGLVGWIARYQLDSVREAAIFAATVGGVTPVVTVSQGHYIYRINGEETRLPDEEQVKIIESSAFSNWYTARKNESRITREYQNSRTELPA